MSKSTVQQLQTHSTYVQSSINVLWEVVAMGRNPSIKMDYVHIAIKVKPQ